MTLPRQPHLWLFVPVMAIGGLLVGTTSSPIHTHSLMASSIAAALPISSLAVPLLVGVNWGLRTEWSHDLTLASLGGSARRSRCVSLLGLLALVVVGIGTFALLYGATVDHEPLPEGVGQAGWTPGQVLLITLSIALCTTAVTMSQGLVAAVTTSGALGFGGAFLLYAAPNFPWIDVLRGLWPTTAARVALLPGAGPVRAIGALTAASGLVFTAASTWVPLETQRPEPRRHREARHRSAWAISLMCTGLVMTAPTWLQHRGIHRLPLALQEQRRAGPVDVAFRYLDAMSTNHLDEAARFTTTGNALAVLHDVPIVATRLGVMSIDLRSSPDITHADVEFNVSGQLFHACMRHPNRIWLVQAISPKACSS